MANRQELQETPWHTRLAEDVIAELETEPDNGLSRREADERLKRYGPNEIRTGEQMPWWRILLRQFTDPLIYILLVAAAVSLLFAEYADMAVILAVVILNGAIGFYQESQARQAIESLAEISAPKAHVVREGDEHEIPSEDVVPGDIVVLSSGMRVPADVRLIDARSLSVDESALTGESEPVNKREDPVEDEHAVPGDQYSMAFSGTNVTRGRGRGVVVRTGEASELGRIAEATHAAGDITTPIKEKMEWLGKAIGVGVLVLAMIVFVGGLLTGMELDEVVQAAVALTVGAVPESLPIVLTVTLAVGVRRMAKRNAIIRSLPAVETLGSTTVIGSDKTGTLTTNQMTVKVIWTGGQLYEVSGSGYDPEGDIKPSGEDSQEEASKALRFTVLTGLLANEAGDPPGKDEDGGGDPTEYALLVSAVKAGLDLDETRNEYSQIDIIPFESERQYMATLNDTPEGCCIFLKGSPEAVLDRCSRQLGPDGDEQDLDADAARRTAAHLADEGYRVLAMAFRCVDLDRLEDQNVESDFVFAGFQGMEDPVRPEALEAVKAAHDAGIRVIMFTGDHIRTARAIGEQLGLAGGDGRAEEGRAIGELSDEELDQLVEDVNIFARVSPEHKLRLVERLRAHGHIVAVTGDGVNDAPALRSAHLGIAMGKSGTDVAREASEMVLADDNFASITNAVEEGRVVFSNIRKVTYFLLCTGLGLVFAILSSLFGPWALPFLAVQVLWINLVTTGLQDIALALEPGEPGLLKQPPRDPKEGVINRPVFWRIIWFGGFMAVATLGVFWWVSQQDVSINLARSVAMTQMVMLQFFHVFNCRSFHQSVFRMSFRSNPYIPAALVIALLAHLSILHVGFMQDIFDTEPISLEIWGIIVVVGLTIVVAAEIDKALFRRRTGGEHDRARSNAGARQPPDAYSTGPN